MNYVSVFNINAQNVLLYKILWTGVLYSDLNINTWLLGYDQKVVGRV